MAKLVWYFTVVLAIWGSSLGGIHISGLGLMYPFRIISLLGLLLVIIQSDKKSWRFSPRIVYCTIVPLILFLVLHAGVTAMWAADRMKSLTSILNLLYVLVFVVLFLNFCRDHKVFNGTLLVLSFNLVLILLFAFSEIFTGVYLFSPVATKNYAKGINDFRLRFPAACFENTNNLAFNICLTIPFVLYSIDYILKLRTWQRAVCKAILLLLATFVIIQTCSRLGYCTYVIAITFYALHYIKKPKTLVAAVVMLFSSAVLVLGGIIASSYIKTTGYDTRVATNNATSVRIRGALVNQALKVSKDSWFLGVGPGSVEVKMKEHNDELLKEWQITSIHQYYIELLAVYGILPLLFLLCMQAATFFLSLRILLGKRNGNRTLALLCLPSTIAMVPATAILSSPMYFFILWVQFSLWSLLMLDYCKKKSDNSQQS